MFVQYKVFVLLSMMIPSTLSTKSPRRVRRLPPSGSISMISPPGWSWRIYSFPELMLSFLFRSAINDYFDPDWDIQINSATRACSILAEQSRSDKTQETWTGRPFRRVLDRFRVECLR